MAQNLANLPYALGKPGMIASTSYKHTRQHVLDTAFVNTTNKNFYYGTAAVVKAGVIETAEVSAPFYVLGVFVDPEHYTGETFYAPKSMLTIATMGDIWVRVPSGITIKPFDPVCYLAATNAVDGVNVPGFFTNANMGAAGVSPYGMPHARFLTANLGGIAAIGLSTWDGNMPN